ncbi:hypothetical protein HanXRQr2_Chr11g0500591 [Helianthus annuus]|uniref:Uncharacterized protein n=1 Tax=Helianthus annuus TaxID=4232 RepID=A0A251S9I6_HELAN|nr:hypothetical protein HanXRQr2_Chr11g0500591 [Helianthus annuus]KAJ0510284.1 hypothetical protein HanIR_Chr11g0538931 [Helianthus annuus]KAJ0875925.1 hypothetical protein HanPSC8_Chr11g0482301 [Helianthus annuus]
MRNRHTTVVLRHSIIPSHQTVTLTRFRLIIWSSSLLSPVSSIWFLIFEVDLINWVLFCLLIR